MNSDSDETVIITSDEEQPDMEVEEVAQVAELPSADQEVQIIRDEPLPNAAPQEQINESVCDDDGSTCPICLDSWKSSGDHRLCALKCGHLFGLECIQRWFAQKQRTCPSCKMRAIKSDIRTIYARKLTAADNSEYEVLKRIIDESSERNTRLQMELTKSTCREHLLLQQVGNLKEEIADLNSKMEMRERFSQSQTQSCKTVQLYRDKSLKICKEAGCRVLDCYVQQDLIVASVKSPNPLFPGFGVCKINISTYKQNAFIPLHSKSIRDLAFHPQNPWLLSVSLDKTLRVVDINSNVPISGYTQNEVPLWACCWDLDNANALYVGTQQGTVLKLDLRNMSEPVITLTVPDDMSPVVALAPTSAGGSLTESGIIVCKLNSLWAFDYTATIRSPIPVEGPFISMKYQRRTNHLLVSARPNSQNSHSRHMVGSIESKDNSLVYKQVHNFTGSSVQKYMSRSCFVENRSDYYVAAHQESYKRVFLWNVNNGQMVCSVPTFEPVLDLCSFTVSDASFLVSLTESKLEFSKFA